MRELYGKSDKNSRIKLNKIRDYVKALSKYGLRMNALTVTQGSIIDRQETGAELFGSFIAFGIISLSS